MKKYHQLLLLIVSVISLSLFLIYRHEYNRLHYVLEVFNFFGQPCNFSDLQKTENILSHHDWGPQPVWQEIDNGYVYSAFLTDKVEAKTLALSGSEKTVPRNCYLWFEDKKKAVVGKFKFSKLYSDENSGLALYQYICTLPNIENEPYAVSFSSKVKRDSDMKKVHLTDSINHNISINTTICVSPTVFNKKRFIEFISFHKLLGIDTFIFYDKDIPHRLSKIISNLSNRLGIHTTYLPWNYPKGDSSMVRTIIENDCLLRTSRQSRYVATLEINEYIIPTNGYGFDSLMKELDSSSERFSLPVQRICIDNLESNRPIALQNFEVSDDSMYTVVRHIYKKSETNNVISTNAVDKSRAHINKYIRCNLEPHKTFTDKSIMKFYTDFSRSTLVQLLMHNQI